MVRRSAAVSTGEFMARLRGGILVDVADELGVPVADLAWVLEHSPFTARAIEATMVVVLARGFGVTRYREDRRDVPLLLASLGLEPWPLPPP